MTRNNTDDVTRGTEPVKWVIVRHGTEEHDVDVVGPFSRRDDAEQYAQTVYGPDAATLGWFVAPLLQPVYDEAPAGAPEPNYIW